jgi:MarR family 2-MHQ and catechol resistance regulon transcriptional repressor
MLSEEFEYIPAQAAPTLDALLVLNILRTYKYVSPFIDNSLRELNLTNAKFNVLLVLYAAGSGGLPLGEIGRRLVVTKANITGLIDRLEEQGYLCREASDDRRITIAKLTRHGKEIVDTILPAHRKLFAEMVDCLSKKEMETVIVLLTKLRKGLHKKFKHGRC